MKVIALQASPRKKGNTNRILDEMIKVQKIKVMKSLNIICKI